MMEKYCIIIDDAYDISATIEDFEHEAHSRGINLHCIHLNPQQEDCLKNVGSISEPKLIIDSSKILGLLQSQDYKYRKADIILCDYDLSDELTNGFELIRLLRNQLQYKREIILFSANIDKVIKDILVSKSQAEKIQRVKNLVYSRIREICDRSNVKSLMISAFEHDGVVLEVEMMKLLQRYERYTFTNGFPEFRGKQISDVINELNQDTVKSRKFKLALIEYAIAQVIEIN